MKRTLYRAADSSEIGAECGRFCLAERQETAAAYHVAHAGLGGASLYQFDVEIPEDRFLDLGDSIPEAMERLAEFAPALLDDCSECSWPYQVLFGCNGWERLAEMGIEWVRFPDEFPVNAITTAYIGAPAIAGVEIA